jgi:hypothetical protein
MAGTFIALLLATKPLAAADALVPLPVVLPKALPRQTPEDLYKGPHVEPPPDPLKYKGRTPFLAPKGVANAAFGKKVTTSAPRLYSGSLPQITDGKKEAREEDVVEMPKGVQWVQIDLEKTYTIYAVVIWHDHREMQAFQCVVVQLSDDPDFKKGVRTIYNNDVANKAGLGIGADKEYFESEEGRLIDAKAAKARYLRCYSNGCNRTKWNTYQEVEVYGLGEN